MTATPHKGDPENFCLFLSLLDKDVYGNISSLQEAMRRNEAPFYLRRTKESLVTFPGPETGTVHKLFTKRDVKTVEFDLDGDEFAFYDELTHYVEDQSMRASAEDNARGRAIGFTMAMLQRRMASTIYAVRRTLERMRSAARRFWLIPKPTASSRLKHGSPTTSTNAPKTNNRRSSPSSKTWWLRWTQQPSGSKSPASPSSLTRPAFLKSGKSSQSSPG